MSQAISAPAIPFGRPWITDDDRRAVMEVLEGHVLTHGPRCQAFESDFGDFLGEGAHCVSVSSGMAALHLACLQFGLGAGDEVIVPAMTHVATVHAVEWVGARPVFVDCQRSTGNVTPAGIRSAITSRTKAIALVHFQGIPCDMPEIMRIAEEHQLKVIEDCALAVGAKYDGCHVGMFGDAACFSFYPVKHFTSGEGGMFVSRHGDVAAAVAKLRAFGVDRRHDERTVPGMYDVLTLGLNYRMSELQAALGKSQLARIGEMLARRQENFFRLKAGFCEMPNVRVLDTETPRAVSAHYALSLVLEGPLKPSRSEIIRRLQKLGIGTSVYYPQPVPRMTWYARKYSFDSSRFPGAVEIADESIAFPVGPHVGPDDVDYIIDQVGSILREIAK